MGCVHARPYFNTGGGGGGPRPSENVGSIAGGTRRREPRTPPPHPLEAAGEEETAGGWPRWLISNVPKGVLDGLVPRSADSYVMIDKVGHGTYSNVYKAQDRDTGKIVALKKVRFDTSESESVRFMAREIMILQKLDHPNIVKLEGLAMSRMQYSLYLVFEFMHSDLARILSRPGANLTEPQVKCYMHQLLSGLQHCHERGILHRDIKGSNMLIDKNGMLKIGDFGLANYFSPERKRPLTSRVVTLWYRAPELLLGATDYGVGIDLWSSGCLLAEMLVGRPILSGRTEVEQLHRIFKLCGSPSEDYWRKLKLPASFRSPQPYKPSILESFQDFSTSSLSLLTTLISLNPLDRGTATSALQSEFFRTSPLACDLSDLPTIPKDEKDDAIAPRSRRKRRTSKSKQRSQMERENHMKLEQDVQIPKVYGENERSELATHSQELVGSNSSTGSGTSSGVEPNRYSLISPRSRPPVSPRLRVQSSQTEYHPFASKNIMNRPPRPAPKTKNAGNQMEGLRGIQHRFAQGKRSVSMTDVGSLAIERLSEHDPLVG